jgi:hypothetical protein
MDLFPAVQVIHCRGMPEGIISASAWSHWRIQCKGRKSWSGQPIFEHKLVNSAPHEYEELNRYVRLIIIPITVSIKWTIQCLTGDIENTMILNRSEMAKVSLYLWSWRIQSRTPFHCWRQWKQNPSRKKESERLRRKRKEDGRSLSYAFQSRKYTRLRM